MKIQKKKSGLIHGKRSLSLLRCLNYWKGMSLLWEDAGVFQCGGRMEISSLLMYFFPSYFLCCVHQIWDFILSTNYLVNWIYKKWFIRKEIRIRRLNGPWGFIQAAKKKTPVGHLNHSDTVKVLACKDCSICISEMKGFSLLDFLLLNFPFPPFF